MLYTAAIMLCLKDEPLNYQNCEIMNSDYKYYTEEQCWKAINGKLNQMVKFSDFTNDYAVNYAQCIKWLPMNENTHRL